MTTSEWNLDGLAGDNPLGFMAAVGALVVADRLWPTARPTLRWRQHHGTWRPVLRAMSTLTETELASALHASLTASLAKADDARDEALKKLVAAQRGRKSDLKKTLTKLDDDAKKLKLKKKSPEYTALRQERTQAQEDAVSLADEELAALRQGGDETLALGENLKVRPTRFEPSLRAAVLAATPASRRSADLFAAFGSEVVLDDGTIAVSRMSKQNGNSGKNMLADLRSIQSSLSVERLTASLFLPWDYADEKWGLGWDPCDVKPFAHQAADPSKGATTMHGANLLAYEALALLPVVVSGHSVETTGTSAQAGRKWAFSWPLWDRPMPLVVLRSLQAHPQIHAQELDAARLRQLGVQAVFRADHFSFNKSPRFKRAVPA